MNMRSPYVSAGFSDLTWQELWPRRDKQINRLVADLQQRNIIIVLVQNNNLKKKTQHCTHSHVCFGLHVEDESTSSFLSKVQMQEFLPR